MITLRRDQIARAIGAGMWFEYDQDVAMIGMMMTHPKLQAGGLAGEILTAIEKQVAGRRMRLNATTSVYQLYRSAGFGDCGDVVQDQGILRGIEHGVEPGIRAACSEDLPAIKALGRAVFGAVGFAMCRPFERGHLIGPLIAGSEKDAIALFAALARDHEGVFLRLDADARFAELARFLNKVGLENYDKSVAMIKGGYFGPEDAQGRVYALASQALG